MCGINGFNWTDENLIESMNKSVAHRGPNDQGSFYNNLISLGHTRLAILDLSEKGHQPMGLNLKNNEIKLIYHDEELIFADLIIVYNGEIYNYQELKNEIIDMIFESESDTEVILKAYLTWGVDCVKKFNGMWAFVIYDRRSQMLFCSRDRLGVKPFYYYISNGKFIFSSEIKAFLEHKSLKINKIDNINQDALELYLSLGHIPSPYSIFKNLYKLEARQNIIYDLKQKKILRKWYYWQLPIYRSINRKKKLIKEGRRLLSDAVRIRMRSDVPVGCFLSGGLDSSSVSSSMREFTDLKRLHTFSIGFKGPYDESYYINIAKNRFQTIHHHYYFEEKDFLSLQEKYAFSYDEPFADFSGYPTLFLSRWTKENVTVVLSGDGGDEIFGGYKFYRELRDLEKIINKLSNYVPKKIRLILSKFNIKTRFKNINILIDKIRKFTKISLINKEQLLFNFILRDNISKVGERYLKKRLKYCLLIGSNKISEAFRIFDMLYRNLQDDFLVKVDRASMAYGLEVRSPFLDYRFAEFGQKIPTRLKFNKINTKILMKQIVQHLVPEEILIQRKQGFTPPIRKWIMKNEYEDDIKHSLDIIKNLNKDISNYYQDKILKKNSDILRIKLLLLYHWWNKWIIHIQ
ncbi:MAG: asparagine synthase (glutamine-hydrolyzing) [Candidatus Odinarchaeota archaeon]